MLRMHEFKPWPKDLKECQFDFCSLLASIRNSYCTLLFLCCPNKKKQKERTAPSLRRDRQRLTALFFQTHPRLCGDSNNGKRVAPFTCRSDGSGFKAWRDQHIKMVHSLLVGGMNTIRLYLISFCSAHLITHTFLWGTKNVYSVIESGIFYPNENWMCPSCDTNLYVKSGDMSEFDTRFLEWEHGCREIGCDAKLWLTLAAYSQGVRPCKEVRTILDRLL